EPAWIGRLSLLRPTNYNFEQPLAPTVALPRQVCYLVQPELSVRHAGLVIELRQRHPTRGGWSALKPLRIAGTLLRELEDPQDRQICGMLLGASRIQGDEDRSRYGEDRQHGTFKLPQGAWRTLLRRMIDTDRCFAEQEDGSLTPLTWDRGTLPGQEEQPWVLW